MLAEGALQPVIGLLSSPCAESKREAALLLGQFATTDNGMLVVASVCVCVCFVFIILCQQWCVRLSPVLRASGRRRCCWASLPPPTTVSVRFVCVLCLSHYARRSTPDYVHDV